MLDLFPTITATFHHGLTSLPAIIWLSTLPIILCIPLLVPYLNPAPPPPRGCRRLGLAPSKQSNLHDEYAPKYTHGVPSTAADESGHPAWRIKALFTYPIKSCTGVELETAEVIETGLKYDRLFCFAELMSPPPSTNTTSSSPTGQWTARTLRDRDFRNLALLRPEIWIPDPTSPSYSPNLPEIQSNGVLIIHYPRLPTTPFTKLLQRLNLLPTTASFTTPLTPPPSQTHLFPLTSVMIWKDSPLAYNYGHLLPDSLRALLTYDTTTPPHLRRPLTLFRECESHHREIFRCAPRKKDIGFQPVTGFADAYPLHLVNMASIRDVAGRCKDAIPRLSVRRFRANVVVQGPGKFEEDMWKRIRVGGSSSPSSTGQVLGSDSVKEGKMEGEGEGDGGVEIHTVCRTIRCKLPNVDPDTGIRHPSEPDRTMRSYRKIDAGDLTNACLGMQLVPAVREFTLRVNDPISVLETGEHFYIKMLAPGEKVEGV
ncbi:hypothetical protein BO78DRAFT_362426 [Aspergillus sclerotiicarbonarius CBS 121057]|uniref:MOSC domain-containing protein n=1 Tax=Aspergillus sclerotiicarbonarius (strain CBS 121057 / IBT 28362) TaxID=1448318 RepID=A0A319EHW8_ASPSB|nr:hypothetical protein BO78DRAFT_362426 [Aspergillus sclerotiicarbonarius CBS 121057]